MIERDAMFNKVIALLEAALGSARSLCLVYMVEEEQMVSIRKGETIRDSKKDFDLHTIFNSTSSRQRTDTRYR